jgi:predicted ester cyclase
LTSHYFSRSFAVVSLLGTMVAVSCARGPEPQQSAVPAHTPESNKAVMRRWIEEGHNRDNLKLLEETFALSYRAHLADGKTADHDMVAEGDRVVTRSNIAATHRASGKRMDVTAMSLARFENGKVVEDWMNMDELRMMTQLGLLPAPGKSAPTDGQQR